jgi:signal peptidase II
MRLYFIIITAFVFVLDQLSKVVVREQGNYSINTGTIFGVFKDNNQLFIFITMAVIAALLYYYYTLKEKNKITTAAVALITAAGLSNLSDRIFLGGVIDYINLKIWPSFNIADTALILGAALLIFEKYKSTAEHKSA